MGDSGNGLHLSGMLLAALALAAWMLQKPPLAPSRPSPGDQLHDSSNSFEDVPARLWQDPFDSVERFRARRHDKQPAQATNPEHPEAANAEQPEADGEHGLLWLCRYLHQKVKPKDELTFLPVMTSTSSYAEASEHRLRLRTAVIAALANNGISPEAGSHIGYWFYPGGDNNTPSATIPYELYRGQGHAVLVLWLPVEHFERDPIDRLALLIGELRKIVDDSWSAADRPKSHRFTLIGPPGSGTLVSMARDAVDSDKHTALDKVEVFAATATAPASTLLDTHELEKYRDPRAPATTADMDQGQLEIMFHQQGMKLIRSILTDTYIASAMVSELALRGVDPACPENPTFPHPRCRKGQSGSYDGHRDHVVLISEADTQFGRSLPQLFNNAVIARMGVPGDETFKGQDLPWIHRFGYLRGVDGELPNHDKKPDTTGPTGLAGLSQLDQSGLEPAAGTSQFDYLRRLAVHIKQMDRELRDNQQGRIRAIGIMGNDVYDKLLILQAMREYFPNLQYFTNDLDARFLNPKDYRWTRNLVVASSFGLQLQPDLQRRVPPLRGVYQTSVFLSTQLALMLNKPYRDSESLRQMLAARIFEVGRGRFIDLGASEGSGTGGQLEVTDKTLSTLYPPPYRAPSLPPRLSLIGLILLLAFTLLVLLVSPLRICLEVSWQKKKPLIPAFLLAVGALGMGVSYFCMSTTQEPFVWASGVSIWPSELIHILCFVLSGLFLYLAVTRVRDVEDRLMDTFHLSPNGQSGQQTIPAAAVAVQQHSGGVIAHFRQALTMFEWYDEPAKQRRADEKDTIQTVWTTYRKHSKQSHRFARAGLIFLLLWVISWVALVYVQPMLIPYRGVAAYYFSFWLGMGPLAITFGLLLFWVMDETRLCSALIRHLCHSKQDWPHVDTEIDERLQREQAYHSTAHRRNGDKEQTYAESAAAQLRHERIQMERSTRQHAMARQIRDYRIQLENKRRTMDFIAQRTALAGDMIWFPFVVLILILVSLSTRFDNYDTKTAVISLLLIALAIALSSAYVLRRTARSAKKQILEQLHKDRLGQQSITAASEPEQIEVLIKQIENIQQGAFRPWYQEPLVRALAWLGSMAAVIITEYLTVSG
jgi:hypothetical protein